ncbi:MAG: prephenate dehydrogenase/arogenate dehydrogenase family protein, partial [Saprospiraceae bacterium]
MKTLTVIGVGHIGGSLALAAKQSGLIDKVIGVDHNTLNLDKALEMGIIEEALPMKQAIEQSDIVAISIPVNAIQSILPEILDQVTHQTVIDVGSTKKNIIKAIAHHPKRKNFIGTHPMAGTEFSGP